MVPDAEWLERLRRSGIRVDREGQFIHEGQPVRHEGLRQALFRWLDRAAAGEGGDAPAAGEGAADEGEAGEGKASERVRYVLRLDQRRFAYLDVDDTPLVVRALRADGAQVWLDLSDGSQEALDPATLTIDDSGILRCWVRGGRLEARLATSAASVLADRISETPQGPALVVDGKAQILGRRLPPE